MTRLRRFIVPGYLLLCLLLGGSVQGIWRNMILQLLAVVVIAWAALSRPADPISRASKLLLVLVILWVLLFVLQLVPLPPNVWTSIPGRDLVAAGYADLGYELPWLPISLTPHATLATSLTLLPPIAVVLGIIWLRAYDERWLIGAILFGVFLNVLLGTLQTAGGGWPDAWWYLYENTNPGAVGFFANRNHMGTLLLVSLPFSTLMLARAAGSTGAKKHSIILIGSSGLIVVFVGLVLNHSLAAVTLAIPVVTASTLLLPRGRRVQRFIFAGGAFAGMFAVLLLTSSPVRSELEGSDTTSMESRGLIWSDSWKAITDSFPAGTGLGSFQDVYRLYEDPTRVERTYVNHAHNDYLEIIMEAGLPGTLLLGGSLFWWALVTVQVWRSPVSSGFTRAATIASGAILAHSIVDYPLRTAAVAALFAACVAAMATGAGERRSGPRGRHIVLG